MYSLEMLGRCQGARRRKSKAKKQTSLWMTHRNTTRECISWRIKTVKGYKSKRYARYFIARSERNQSFRMTIRKRLCWRRYPGPIAQIRRHDTTYRPCACTYSVSGFKSGVEDHPSAGRSHSGILRICGKLCQSEEDRSSPIRGKGPALRSHQGLRDFLRSLGVDRRIASAEPERPVPGSPKVFIFFFR